MTVFEDVSRNVDYFIDDPLGGIATVFDERREIGNDYGNRTILEGSHIELSLVKFGVTIDPSGYSPSPFCFRFGL